MPDAWCLMPDVWWLTSHKQLHWYLGIVESKINCLCKALHMHTYISHKYPISAQAGSVNLCWNVQRSIRINHCIVNMLWELLSIICSASSEDEKSLKKRVSNSAAQLSEQQKRNNFRANQLHFGQIVFTKVKLRELYIMYICIYNAL